jgi:hypothetical protein
MILPELTSVHASSEDVGDSVQLGVRMSAASSIEGEGLVLVLHGKPLKEPPFNAVLQRDIKVFDFSAPTKLQAGTTNKLMLSSGHPGPTVVEIFPKPEMRKNTKESLAEVNKHNNFKNKIGV